jgi:hypothetical protein
MKNAQVERLPRIVTSKPSRARLVRAAKMIERHACVLQTMARRLRRMPAAKRAPLARAILSRLAAEMVAL